MKKDRHDGTDARPRRDAQCVWIGQRVAQQTLKRSSRNGERSADKPGQYDARQADAQNDVFMVFADFNRDASSSQFAPKNVHHFFDGNVHRADRYTDDDRCGKYKRQQHVKQEKFCSGQFIRIQLFQAFLPLCSMNHYVKCVAK